MTFGGNIGCEWTIEELSKFWKDMVGGGGIGVIISSNNTVV